MYKSATAETQYTLQNATDGTPLELKPGQGVCIGIGAFWAYDIAAHTTTTQSPVDDAAQADAMKFDVRFDLVQI